MSAHPQDASSIHHRDDRRFHQGIAHDTYESALLSICLQLTFLTNEEITQVDETVGRSIEEGRMIIKLSPRAVVRYIIRGVSSAWPVFVPTHQHVLKL